MRSLLLSFVGFHDPYSAGLVDQQEQAGPILTLLRERHFARAVFFSTPGTARNAESLQAAVAERHAGLEAEFVFLDLADPTDYGAIFAGLDAAVQNIRAEHPPGEWEYFISITSGTPQMHVTWLALVGSGRIAARVLNVRPAKFVTLHSPLITEISPVLPTPAIGAEVRVPAEGNGVSDETAETIAAARRRLGLAGEAPKFLDVLSRAAMLAPTTLPVLIVGETGTGKELVAKFIHQLSGRPREKFVPVNCAAIPAELFESTLFGHKKGSFTGATEDRKGKFELADGGTLFLDELGELPIEMQPKLLRVLQDGIVEPVGESKGRKVDVRVVSATNLKLEEALEQKRFRMDLYYRLKSGVCRLPALRERRSDIQPIAFHILDLVNGKLSRPKRFTPAALEWLQSRSWHGNIRELENTILTASAFSTGAVIDLEHLKVAYGDPIELSVGAVSLPDPAEGFDLKEFLQDCRKRLIERSLTLSGGNQTKAAGLLGLTPQALSKELGKR